MWSTNAQSIKYSNVPIRSTIKISCTCTVKLYSCPCTAQYCINKQNEEPSSMLQVIKASRQWQVSQLVVWVFVVGTH